MAVDVNNTPVSSGAAPALQHSPSMMFWNHGRFVRRALLFVLFWFGLPTASLTERSESWIHASLSAHVILDLKRPQTPKLAQALLERLDADEFGEQHPFRTLDHFVNLATVLAKGVEAYRRTSYRTPQFVAATGYNFVTYEIDHTDHSQSTLVAFTDRDHITVQIITNTEGGDASEQRLVVFTDGKMQGISRVPSEEAFQQKESLVLESTLLDQSRSSSSL